MVQKLFHRFSAGNFNLGRPRTKISEKRKIIASIWNHFHNAINENAMYWWHKPKTIIVDSWWAILCSNRGNCIFSLNCTSLNWNSSLYLLCMTLIFNYGILRREICTHFQRFVVVVVKDKHNAPMRQDFHPESYGFGHNAHIFTLGTNADLFSFYIFTQINLQSPRTFWAHNKLNVNIYVP